MNKDSTAHCAASDGQAAVTVAAREDAVQITPVSKQRLSELWESNNLKAYVDREREVKALYEASKRAEAADSHLLKSHSIHASPEKTCMSW